MSPEPRKSLNIEPVPTGEDSAEATPKRRSSTQKKKTISVEAQAEDVAPAHEVSPKKTARKSSRKPSAIDDSISVDAVETASQAPEIVISPVVESPAVEVAAAPPIAQPKEVKEEEAVAAELTHEIEEEAEDEPGFLPRDEDDFDVPQQSRPAIEPHLERLQKILSHAGISSRRAAEEMILGGRVQVNGQIVSTLGAKADPARDHIRVDGKLLQGPERHRYFMLNKPKGYVTTVSDPEGRPTVMKFFAGERERLYPVGRLDYLSEGLLLVTNDGDLANKLTRASSGVEKTYYVKVSGQPGEEMLDALREGVMIERGRPGTGSGRVRTAPARIRQVRAGDNPWYEVTVIEGRNRELRKMFEEIGHHVEKIRRVGYGPLILDLEPGKVRELEAEEIRLLTLAAEGKLKTRRRRGPAPAQLPRKAGSAVEFPRTGPKARPERPADSATRRPKPEWKSPATRGDRRPPVRTDTRFGRPARPRPEGTGTEGSRPERKSFGRTGTDRRYPDRSAQGPRPPSRRSPERQNPERPSPERPSPGRPAQIRQRPSGQSPAGQRPDRGSGQRAPGRPRFESSRPEQGAPIRRRPDTADREDRPRQSNQERGRFGGGRPQRTFPGRERGSEPRPNRPPKPARPSNRAPIDHDDFDPPRVGIRITPAEPHSEPRPRRTERPRTEKTFSKPGRPTGKFTGTRPPRSAAPGGPPRPAGKRPTERADDSGGAPRKKERWRDSYTGKNKGRPKPKPRRPE